MSVLKSRQICLKPNKCIAFGVIIIFFVVLTGCITLRINDPERKVQKHQEKENKKLKKAYQTDVKKQYKMQSKETRKRMNKNLNKVDKDFKRKTGKSRWKCS